MRVLKIVLFAWAYFLFVATVSLAAQSRIKLVDVQNHCTDLRTLAAGRAVVVVMLAAECPISQAQSAELDTLAQLYPDICVVGVFTKWENANAIDTFRQQLKPTYQLVHDTRGRLTRKLNASVTPEAFFLATDLHTVMYQGAINDKFMSLGNAKRTIGNHYLRQAMQDIHRGELPKISKTTPIGCLIDR